MSDLRVSLTRRGFLTRTAQIVGATATLSLLAACGGDDEPAPSPAPDDEPVTGESDAEPTDEAEPTETEDEPAQAGSGGTVNVVMPQLASDPTTMNPLFTSSGAEQAVCALIFGGLLKMDETMTPVPDLVDTWEISDDAMNLTFNLLEDATWSDGEPVTAEDVIFTFERAVHPEVGSTRSAMPQQIRGAREYRDGEADTIAGLSAPDPKTLEIELAQPNAIWALQLTALTGQGFLPRHIYEDIEPAQLGGHELSRNPEVGAGPFLLSRWETEQYLEFTANDNYVRGRPSLDNIIMRLLLPDVALAQLETGELDLANVSFDELERVEGLANVEVISNPSVSITQLQVNTSRPYLTVPVRQAFMYAIDHEGIVNAAYQGMAEPVYSTVIGPDWMGDIVADADLNTYPYDPERAMQILEEEGWDPNQTVELIYVTDMIDELPAWTLIQQNLRAVGVNLELRQYEFATMRSLRTDGEYDLTVLRGGIPKVDPGTALNSFIPLPDGSDNVLRYNNPELTELVQEGTQYVDEAQRREIYLEVAKILNEELPHIYLWSPQIIFAHSQRFNGFITPGHFSNIFWNAHEWSVDE